jgi:hypothetical protein
MSKAIRASALVLLLACSAYAGDIQNGVTGTPPPPSINVAQEPTTDGDIQNGVVDTIMNTVLTVLNNVLALL